jgi:hypothetical protein
VFTYVCLFFNDDDVVCAADILTGASKTAVKAKALELLRSCDDATGFELWLDGTKVLACFPARDPDAEAI